MIDVDLTFRIQVNEFRSVFKMALSELAILDVEKAAEAQSYGDMRSVPYEDAELAVQIGSWGKDAAIQAAATINALCQERSTIRYRSGSYRYGMHTCIVDGVLLFAGVNHLRPREYCFGWSIDVLN